MDTDKSMIGVFSWEHYKMSGAAVYETPSGEKVLCTCVYQVSQKDQYLWSDTVEVGPVVQWLGHRGKKLIYQKPLINQDFENRTVDKDLPVSKPIYDLERLKNLLNED